MGLFSKMAGVGGLLIASLGFSGSAYATCRTYNVWINQNGSSVKQTWLLSSSMDINDRDGQKIIEQAAKANYSGVSVSYSGGAGGTNVCSSGQRQSADNVIVR